MKHFLQSKQQKIIQIGEDFNIIIINYHTYQGVLRVTKQLLFCSRGYYCLSESSMAIRKYLI